MDRLRLLVAGVAALLLAACGSGEVDVADATSRYCELSAQLDAAGEGLELDAESTQEDIQAGFTQFIDENEDTLSELEDVAPEEISDDVSQLVDSLRQVAETGDAAAFEGAQEAEDRVQQFEEENCPDAAADDAPAAATESE